MSRSYVYGWSLRPQEGMEVELRVEATSAVDARRQVTLFLEHHDALAWKVRSVCRWTSAPPVGSAGPAVTFIGPRQPS